MSIVKIIPETELAAGVSNLDIFVIVFVLSAVFLTGLQASIQANHSSWKALFTTCYKSKRSISTSGISSPELEPSRTSTNAAAYYYSSSKLEQAEDNNTSDEDAAQSFFLADKSMPFYFVGASLFASNIGSEHFVGQSGDGARRGLVAANFEWNVIILILCLGWIFAPIYRRSNVYTTPEYLEKRFNSNCRHYLTFITCAMYVLTKLSASIYGGAIVLSTALGWDMYLCAGICIVLSMIYTVSGGLRAVMYTDFIQTAVFLVGGTIVSAVALNHIGGFSGLQEILVSDPETREFLHIFKPVSDPDYPWTGMLLGQPIMASWYWCFDQDLVQRVLSAKNDVHSKSGCVMACFLKILPPLIIILPGIISGILYDFKAAGVSTDSAYPILLINLMPRGVIGLMVASIMTAMMSSLDSVFNAGSSIVMNDIYKKWRPNAPAAHLVWVGRVSTVVFALLSFAWIPMISDGGGMFRYLLDIQAHLVSPFGIILWLGTCWKGANGTGAFAGLAVGGTIGVARLIFVIIARNKKSSNVLPSSIAWIESMSFQHVAIILWVISGATCVVVSLLYKGEEKKDLERYMIQWKDVFAVSSDEKAYPPYVRKLMYGSAIAALGSLVSLWIVFG